MLGFPTVCELGNPGWRKNGHFQREKTLASELNAGYLYLLFSSMNKGTLAFFPIW